MRLEGLVKQLNRAHGTYLNGFKFSKEATAIAPVTAAEVFDSSRVVLPLRKTFPPSAFLVPAILDALRTSKYALITSVVPGEADLFCARAALEPRRTIFTNDSDLLLYDLGTFSEVAFFNQLGLQISDDSSRNCASLYARLSQPAKIASRLGLEGLRRLAFEIREDKSVNLHHAIMRAKQSKAILASQSSSIRQNSFEKFEKEYDTEFSDPEAFTKAGKTFSTNLSQGSFLDPRLSELVSRAPNPSSIFLPFLTDDFSRSSAWDVSRELRYFAYSCLVFKNSDKCLEQVSEYVRRGARIVGDDLSLLSREETIKYATALTVKLEKFKSFLADFSTQSIWRPFALYEVFYWYISSGKEPPSKDMLTAVFSGANKDERLSWYEVHISAQLQAVLYSLRMLLQILRHLIFATQENIKTSQIIHKEHLANCTAESLEFHEPSNLPAELLKLEHLLSTLPLLGELIPSRLELAATPTMPAVEVEYFLAALFTSTLIDISPSKGCKEDVIAPSNRTTDGIHCEKNDAQKKIHTISARSSGNIDVPKGLDGNNRFNVLERE